MKDGLAKKYSIEISQLLADLPSIYLSTSRSDCDSNDPHDAIVSIHRACAADVVINLRTEACCLAFIKGIQLGAQVAEAEHVS